MVSESFVIHCVGKDIFAKWVIQTYIEFQLAVFLGINLQDTTTNTF